ncbi:MAG: PAS domain-containing protein [Candidatus Jettenia sp. CY-1]|nr:MAG: PAS domain-containing protein [Candidatus Jettenia sp. CY-1]
MNDACTQNEFKQTNKLLKQTEKLLAENSNNVPDEFTENIKKIINKLYEYQNIWETQKYKKEVFLISENKCKLLHENLPVKIFYKDKRSIYLFCNENFARYLHIKTEEIVGKTDYDFFPEDIAKEYREYDKEVIRSGQRKDKEKRYWKDGQELIFYTIKVPVKDEKGDIIGILGTALDMAERVKLEKDTERSRHLALLSELAAGVAHEINNPITGVINCAQILFNKSHEGSREKNLASRIIKEGDRIANIVSKLLSFARGSDVKGKTMASIHEIVSDILTLTGTQLQKDCIKIKLDIPNNLPKILVNFQEIQEVFMNLISNARYALNQKYPKSHGNKIIEILAEEITIHEHKFVKTTFYNHGTGIPSYITENGIRAKYLSHAIVNDHGGKLTIDSIEGKYTKISIILPDIREVFLLKQNVGV